MIHLDYRDARPIYTQIGDHYRQLIIAGILQKDDLLPSVRVLAAQLTINPNTIQRAYRELEQEGLIATVPGKGCFVCYEASKGSDNTQLWQALDAAVEALAAAGVQKADILQYLKQGGNRND